MIAIPVALAITRLVSSDADRSVMDGGLAPVRFDRDDAVLQLGRLRLALTQPIGEVFSARLDASVYDDKGGALAGLSEAYLQFRPYPRAVAGDAVTFSYDASSRAATLQYTPAPGISEVAVPVRAYPSGYSVQATGGCVDTSQPGRLLVQASPGATAVEVQVTPR